MFKRIANYLVNPQEIKPFEDSIFRKILYTLKVLILTALVLILINFIGKSLIGIFELISSKKAQEPESSGGYEYFLSLPEIWRFIFVGLFFPIIEELAFRLLLVKQKINFHISASILIAMVPIYIFPNELVAFFNRYISYTASIFAMYFVIVGLTYALLQIFINRLWSTISFLWSSRYYIFLFYFSVLSFAFLHFVTFASLEGIALIVLNLISVFVMGISLSLVRIRAGILYAILLHIIWNSLSLLKN